MSVFSPAFASATVFLAPQILGDACKLTSLVFVYHLMSRNRASVQAATELIQAGIILVVYCVLVESLGRMAAVISYAIATPIVLAATLILVARDPRPTVEATGPPEDPASTL